MTSDALLSLIEHTVAEAQAQQLVREKVANMFRKHFTQFSNTHSVAAKVSVGKHFQKNFDAAREEFAQLSEQELNELSKLNALTAILANADALARQSRQEASLKDRFKTFIGQHADQTDALKSRLNQLVISLVHTMHPTIFHAQDGRRLEESLVRNFENGDVSNAHQTIREFIGGMKDNKKSITFHRQITVAEETELELRNLKRLQERFDHVIDAWNQAAQENGQPTLSIDHARRKKMLELRTWGRGADADGREKSTAALLYESIHMAAEDGVYKGETFDLRQNAAEHRDALSAFIQRKYLDSQNKRYGETAEFKTMVDAFMHQKEQDSKYKDSRRKWNGAENSLFQHLMYEDKEADTRDFKDAFEFVDTMIKKNIPLVPPQLAVDVREVMEAYFTAKKEFAQQHNLDPRFTLEQLQGKLDVNNHGMPLAAKWNEYLENHNIRADGLSYVRHSMAGSDTEDGRQQRRMQNYFEGRKKLDPSREIIELKKEERSTLIDVAKRMIIINQAIETCGSNPESNPVATRYQIANFSDATDFMIALKLFAETGLAEIDHGEVKKIKLGIMPLLETKNDLQNAEKIYGELLSNDVALSYFAKRGKAEIMVGFSDGAASAGNFPSQWEIYKATRTLIELFDKAKAQGKLPQSFTVEILQGRGRGFDRGGTVDPRLQMELMPPEVYREGRYDVTVQSDLPTDIAAARGYGEHYLGNVLLGMLEAPLKARDEKAERAAEPMLDKIAETAAAAYNQTVRENPDALKFFNAMPDNPYKSSRSTARGCTPHYNHFDTLRAIPKEYFLGSVDLPAHNIGLSHALKAHGAQSNALMRHPFFAAAAREVLSGMQHYNPYIAQAYGERMGTPEFTHQAVEKLNGLSGLLGQKTGYALEPEYVNHAAIAVDNIAHAIDLTGVNGRNFRPNPKLSGEAQWADTLRHTLFTKAQQIGHRELVAAVPQLPQRIAL